MLAVGTTVCHSPTNDGGWRRDPDFVSALTPFCSPSTVFVTVYVISPIFPSLWHLSVAQRRSHRWDITYSTCTKTCGGGTQFRIDRCYTTSQPSHMAPMGYCNRLSPPTEPSVRSCNTQPCTMCDRTYSALSGTLSSPYWPDKRTIPRYCRLVIDVDPQRRILLGFSEFVLEGVDLFHPARTEEDVCLCGVLVEISDGGSRHNRYCGTKKPFAWVSETDRVTVEFITQYSLVFNRFIANYTTITKQPSCYEFIDLTGFVNDPDTEEPLPQEGFLHSLNFPNAYPDNQHCEFVLHANPEHRIILYFDEFELEPGPNCEADYVKVEDFYSRRFDVYCGKQHSFSWLSDSNEVWITFRTDAKQVYTGFLLAYELMDREADNIIVLEEVSGFFTSPGFPIIYPPNESVEYAIRTTPQNLLIITFHEFQLERDDYGAPLPIEIFRRSTLNDYQNHFGDPYTSCVDFVKVIDILDNHEEMYCGRIPVFTYISRGNEVLIQFKTDNTMQYRGFNASYRSIERRTPTDWEMVFRVAKGGEVDAVDKFLFQDRGFNTRSPSAKSTTLTRSTATYKHQDVPDWEDIGVRKVKIDVYTAGSIHATFRFQALDSTLSSWFDCQNMIYSSYDDLNTISCDELVFGLLAEDEDEKEFEIETLMSNETCDDDEDRRVWLDLQEVDSERNCTYEAPENREGEVEIINSIIFISSAATGGETATGANIVEADIFTIWIQRDCDKRVTLMRENSTELSSQGFGERDYSNNEYCDIFMDAAPFDRLFVEFDSFELEEDECLANDYVQLENPDTAFLQTFCGKQHHVVWTTTANAVILRFRTDAIVTYDGWRAFVTAERRNLEDCSLVQTTPTGNLTNPEHPNSLQEYRYYGCEYIVHAHPNDRVIVSFSSYIFQTENPPEMMLDPRTSDLNFIEISGFLLPFSWTSDSNELSVAYHAPLPYRTYILFEADYRRLEAPQPASCQRFHDAGFGGTFSWPLESMSTGLQNCYVVVRTDPDESLRVQLVFRNLKMPQSDCNSYINTIDTTTRRNDMYCQRIRLSFSWTSDANEVIVQFFHGPTFALHQVEAEFRSRERVQPADAEVLTNQAGGAFASPNYPHPYNGDSKKEFLFHASPEHLVIVVFKDFSLEGAIEPSNLQTSSRRRRSASGKKSHYRHMYRRQAQSEPSTAECEYDSVTVEDVLEDTVTSYCGDQQPFGVMTQGNEALVRFTSDATVEKRGFNALYAFEPRPAISDCGQLFTRDEGVLQSPDYPNHYPNGVYCRDVIQVDPTNRIVIDFNFLNIQSDPKCSKDYLEVRDVVTGYKRVYCGKYSSSFSWVSNTNLVFLTFISDDAKTSSGYDATYSVEDRSDDPTCVYNITGSSGTIHSPRFPRDYANQLRCEYNITVDPGYGVQLTFQEFHLEPPLPGSTQCTFDYVQIIDPTTVNIVTAEKLCGKKNPFERLVETNQVTIIFNSDFISFYEGFLAEYQQVSLGGQNIESCNEELTGTSGYFSSPGYPGNYPDNALCITRIIVPEGYHVIITFNDFNTEGYTGCPYDFVLVEDLVSGLSEKFCGRKQYSFTWTSQSNQVTVTFKSDDRTPSSGFYASYESEPDPQPSTLPITGCEYGGFTEISQDSGVLQSPNYPSLYPLDIDCVVRINVQPYFVCVITFTYFSLEDSSSCQYDYLKVTSIPDGASEKFCGSRPSFTWRSHSSTCEVHFHSDEYVKASGYTAEFTAAPQTPSNNIQPPYGPYQNYPPQPQVPEYNQPPQPVVPGPYEPPQPVVPGPYEPPQPVVPLPYEPPQPVVPGPYEPPQPVMPLPYEPPQPVVPGPYEPPQPVVPGPYEQPQPVVPLPYEPPQPVVPGPYEPPQPVVPGPYEPPQPVVPLPYEPPQPVVPLPYEPPQPVVPLPYEPPEPVVPLPYEPPQPVQPPPYVPPEPVVPAPYAPQPVVPAPYPPQEPATDCQQSLQALPGVTRSFATPQWPDRYPINVQCQTVITSALGTRIRIRFSSFHIEAENCAFDYVAIIEAVATGLPPRLCGEREPFVYDTKTNHVTIKFVSDAYVTRPGYLATYTQI
ncbi:cubilin-like [Diadema setosum]|uniref:cubilin-like n=1 Tax=Diadema setosum TaxID=31175 RepID=UPI003B3A5DED